MQSYEELEENERKLLTPDELRTYDIAIYFCRMENSGGIGGGWMDGFNILKKLGWEIIEIPNGIRSYVDCNKPEKFTIAE